MSKKLILNRDIPKSECDWLDRDFKKEETVYEYYGPTYGCISPDGTACTLSKEGETPFFELPTEALSQSNKPQQ